tara:strand:- start:810 stop:1226 length:417 start_codon:yes stop_codon:yes gene_type:complete
MYDPDPEHYEYDDDDFQNYPHEYNEHGYPKNFKFDWSAWESWLMDAIKDIQEDNNSWYLGHYKVEEEKSSDKKSSTGGSLNNKYFIYLGSNSFKEPIWKTKYFVVDKIQQEYNAHISAHAKHFLLQPQYYKSMFDILN